MSVTTPHAPTGVFERATDLCTYIREAGYKVSLDASGAVRLDPPPNPRGPMQMALDRHRSALAAMIRAGHHLKKEK